MKQPSHPRLPSIMPFSPNYSFLIEYQLVGTIKLQSLCTSLYDIARYTLTTAVFAIVIGL